MAYQSGLLRGLDSLKHALEETALFAFVHTS